MQTAGARALRESDNGMSREAVLLQWERKIEDAERRESDRFEREQEADGPVAEPVPLRPAETATTAGTRRFERADAERERDSADGERRTITITGQPTPARRRRSVVEAQMAQPDRIALWAFLLGLFLVAVAAGTAHS
jgi:hypothetical protein